MHEKRDPLEQEFFDWLSECPAEWFLQCENTDGRSYIFIDNDEDDEVAEDE